MSSELAVDRFLNLLERSRLLSDEQVQQLLDEFGASDSPFDDSQKIADELVSRDVITSWQAGMLLQGKHRGFILGSYRILEPLGKGGMGAVFLAEHQRMHRRCAIKVLPTDHAKKEASLLDRFYREAEAVARLDHPNIVRAYDVNSSTENNKEIHYLVMEYVDGHDLQQLVQSKGVLGYREAADLIRQAAEGLAHAHEAGLVHRDIKPANLLLDSKGVVKVLDLGLAVFTETGDASLTSEMGDTVLGTADYLAPEQALDSHNIDARADIYSLGQTFYFLLVGHPPFPEGTVAQRLLAHQLKEPEPINATRPDAPLSLLAIIQKMTAKKPEQRYQTAAEVASALSDWAKGQSEGSGFLARQSRLGGDSRIGLKRPAEPTRPTSSHSVETDLELAPLDDEPKPKSVGLGSSGSSGKLSQSSTKLPGSGTKLPAARGDSQAGSSAERLAASQSDALSASFPSKPPGEKKPSDVDDEDVGEDYQLSGDLEGITPLEGASNAPAAAEPAPVESPLDDLLSSPLPPAPAPATTSGAHEAPRPRPRTGSAERSVFSTLLESGVFWIGLAVVVVLGLIIAILVSGPAAKPPDPTASHPATESDAPAKSAGPAASAEKPAASKKKPSTSKPADKAKPAPTPKPQQSEKKQNNTQTKSGGNANKGENKNAKPNEKPSAPPAKKPAAQKAAEPDKAPAKAAPAAKPPAKKGPDPQVLFAGVRSVSLEWDSFDNTRTSKLNMMLLREAENAVDRIGATLSKTDEAVLHVAITAETRGQVVRLTLHGELTCQVSGGPVTVWEHEGEVATIARAVMQGNAALMTVRNGIKDFFDEFVDAHERAVKATEK